MAEQYGFFVDTSRCVKCWACYVACKQWNNIEAGTIARRNVNEEWIGEFPTGRRHFQSMSCMHCENPACLEMCPTGAISKREEDGAVVVDKEVCIGCKTCESACPYSVPQYIELPEGGLKMDKCDMCNGIGREDDTTHCVLTCPTQALHFGPLSEMEALAAEKGGERLEGETGPSVYIV